MAMAPVVYTLWQHFLRLRPPGSDLAQPRPIRAVGRPRVDAAVLGAAPDRRRRGRPGLRAVGELSVTLDDIKRFRQLDSKCPGHPSTAGPPASKPRPVRSGKASPRASGWRSRAGGWPRTSTAPASTMFDFDVYALGGDGCLMEGISHEAASLAGHLKPRQPLLDLRQQPHLDRGPHRARLLRRRGDPLPRLWLERDPRGQRQRPGDGGPRAARCSRDERTRPTLVIVDSHIGYGAPHKEDTGRRARRAPGRRGGPRRPRGSTVGRRTRSSWSPTASGSTSRRAIGRRGSEARDAGRRCSSEYRRAYPEQADAGAPDAAPPAAGRLGRTDTRLPRRRQGRWPAARPPGKVAERDRAERALADRRCRRPRALDQDPPHVRRRGRLRGRAATAGRNFHFGIREHAMGAIVNGHVAVEAAALRVAASSIFTDTCSRRSGSRR